MLLVYFAIANSSSRRTLHAVAVETPLTSSIGASSLRSAPTIFAWATVRIASRSSRKLTPPASGVPVPGNADGSRQSRSIVKYTGIFFSFSFLDCLFQTIKSKRMKIGMLRGKLKFFSLTASDAELMNAVIAQKLMTSSQYTGMT